MDDNQGFDEKNPDVYEEILVSEDLDQYEGLLNRSKRTRAYLKNSTNYKTNCMGWDPVSPE